MGWWKDVLLSDQWKRRSLNQSLRLTMASACRGKGGIIGDAFNGSAGLRCLLWMVLYQRLDVRLSTSSS